MNWLLIAVTLFLVGFAIKGGKVGFIKTTFSVASIVISLTLSLAISPYISKALQNNKTINEFVTDRIEKIIKLEDKEVKVTKEVEIIDKLNLPKALKNTLKENNNSEVYKALAIKSFKEYISGYLALIIINSISFIVLFLIINILIFILGSALDLISKLPVINGFNKTAGVIVGLLQGLVIIWVLCIVLTMFSSEEMGQKLYALINQSKLLSQIYNNNVLLMIITDITKILF